MSFPSLVFHNSKQRSPRQNCPTWLCPMFVQDYIGETGELALSAVIAGVDTAVSEDGGILAKRERTEQVRLS